MVTQHRSMLRPADSVQVVLYRIGALSLGIAWPLWLTLLALTRSGPGGIFAHWYPATTFLLFCSAEVLLLVAWAVGRLGLLTVALRWCGVTLVLALLLLLADPFTGSYGHTRCLWFSGMTGVPAVAVALTVSRRAATAFFVPVVGIAALADSFLSGTHRPIALVSAVIFGLVYSYYFVAVASTMIRLVRVIDGTAAAARHEQDRAVALRRQAGEEDAALVRWRDRVLAGLAVTAAGRRPDPGLAGPGAGTTGTDPAGPAGPAADPEDPSLHEATGFDRVFSWPYLSLCAVAVVFRLCATAEPLHWAGLLTVALVCLALALLVTRTWGRLALWRALVIAGALCAAVVVGLWQAPAPGHHWASHWEFGAASLVAALTVARGRALVAVVGVLAAVALLAVLHTTGLSPDPRVTGRGLALNSIVVAGAVLLRRTVDRFVDRIPPARQRYLDALAVAEDAARGVGTVRETRRTLARCVGPVFTAAARLPVVTPALARRAELTRLQVTDMAAAPRLAVPALQEAVWDARARGVTVELVDGAAGGPVDGAGATSRSGEGSAPPLTDAEVAALIARAVPEVDAATSGTVTVRL